MVGPTQTVFEAFSQITSNLSRVMQSKECSNQEAGPQKRALDLAQMEQYAEHSNFASKIKVHNHACNLCYGLSVQLLCYYIYYMLMIYQSHADAQHAS